MPHYLATERVAFSCRCGDKMRLGPCRDVRVGSRLKVSAFGRREGGGRLRSGLGVGARWPGEAASTVPDVAQRVTGEKKPPKIYLGASFGDADARAGCGAGTAVQPSTSPTGLHRRECRLDHLSTLERVWRSKAATVPDLAQGGRWCSTTSNEKPERAEDAPAYLVRSFIPGSHGGSGCGSGHPPLADIDRGRALSVPRGRPPWTPSPPGPFRLDGSISLGCSRFVDPARRRGEKYPSSAVKNSTLP